MCNNSSLIMINQGQRETNKKHHLLHSGKFNAPVFALSASIYGVYVFHFQQKSSVTFMFLYGGG